MQNGERELLMFTQFNPNADQNTCILIRFSMFFRNFMGF